MKKAQPKRPYRRNVQRLKRTQGCLTDCVAYVFNLHPSRVPLFSLPRSRWVERLKRFFRVRGKAVHWRICSRVPKRGIHIVAGDSLTHKTYAHAVIYRNSRLAYDPEFPSRWTDKRITHRLVVSNGSH